MNDWRGTSYYPTENRPCDICGKIGPNGIEPRFGYVTCEIHANITPAYRAEYKEEYRHGHIRTPV